jgi:prepilin-type processing-associated H-X9-DG protein
VLAIGKGQYKQYRRQSVKLVIWKIVAAVIIFLLIAAILWPALIHLREYRRRIRCAKNLKCLAKAALIYSCGDTPYPAADKWCDILLEEMDVTEKEFVCPSAGEGRCHYAINPSVSPHSNPRFVLLFETKGGWNQFGGPGLVTFENHEGKGCNILFNDLHVNFVKPNQLADLKWKGGQKQ